MNDLTLREAHDTLERGREGRWALRGRCCMCGRKGRLVSFEIKHKLRADKNSY